MAIIILTALSGILILILPFIMKGFLRKKFPNIPDSKSMYWRSGLYFLMISFLYSVVISNISQKLLEAPAYVYALIVSVIVALFTELGRFFILDKVIKVRDKNGMIEFGLGFLSVITVIAGIFLIISSLVYYYFHQNPNIHADFSYLGKTEFANLQLLQEIALDYLKQNPLIALGPILERIAELFLSVYLSFLIVLGIEKSQQIKIWQAVLIKILFLFLIFLKPFGDNLSLNEGIDALIYIATIFFAWLSVKKLIASKNPEPLQN